ncbi:hypothetical protein EX30DRAFT_342998 [Ascodesmis nigricans]|uniref:Uncharacterized protein n=1 Tax=Ascodesmis nigricans TaxID=341454 RepID=A0A4S2MRK5_9PEZI|nr:hypothetical protein EX30DRAFT_342998 [Ascodesmis nigricans]
MSRSKSNRAASKEVASKEPSRPNPTSITKPVSIPAALYCSSISVPTTPDPNINNKSPESYTMEPTPSPPASHHHPPLPVVFPRHFLSLLLAAFLLNAFRLTASATDPFCQARYAIAFTFLAVFLANLAVDDATSPMLRKATLGASKACLKLVLLGTVNLVMGHVLVTPLAEIRVVPVVGVLGIVVAALATAEYGGYPLGEFVYHGWEE